MIRLKDIKHSNTASFLSSAVRTAEYYGFEPLEGMEVTRLRGENRPALKKSDGEIAFARREERPLAVSARRCITRARGSERTTLVWRISSSGTPRTAGMPSVSFELHIIGNSSAIAEALLIVVANAIALEAGIEQRTLSINSIGSMDSSNRYVRDVSAYLRKHIESISPTLRPRAATDPLGALVQLIERGHPAVPRAPQAMEYLTEEERRRFWELLEYLEAFGLPYELSPHVLGSRDCWSHSLFEITAPDEETGARISLAFGGRYDPLALRFARAPLPSAMISISCEARGRSLSRRMQGQRNRVNAPSLYFAHLGSEARRRSLPILETLRKEGVPVHQGILFGRIGEQMTAARRHAAPYILIMGHKEAVEGTILVREVATNSQEAVPLPDLMGYLRRRRIAAPAVARA